MVSGGNTLKRKVNESKQGKEEPKYKTDSVENEAEVIFWKYSRLCML